MGVQVTVFLDDDLDDVSAMDIQNVLKADGYKVHSVKCRRHTPKALQHNNIGQPMGTGRA